MTVTDTEVQAQLAQAPPNPLSPTDAAASFYAGANADPTLTTSRMLSPTEAAAATGPYAGSLAAPKVPNDGSMRAKLTAALAEAPNFSQRFAADLNSPLAPGEKPLPPMQTFMQAGVKAMAPDTGSKWDAAMSDADKSQPTKAPMQEDRTSGPANIIGNLLAEQGGGFVEGGGALAGAATAAQIHGARSEQQKQDRINMADANAKMLHEQIALHKLGEDAVAAGIESGKAGLEAIKNAKVPGTVIATDQDSDEIKRGIGKSWKPTEDTVFLTGRKMIGKDANGVPMFRSTYTIVKPGGPVDPSADEAKFIKDNGGPDLFAYTTDKDGKKVPVLDDKGKPTMLKNIAPQLFNSAWQNASNAAVNQLNFNKTLEANQISKDNLEISKESSSLHNDTSLTQIYGKVSAPKGSKDTDPYASVKVYEYVQNHREDPIVQKLLADNPQFMRAFPESFGQDSKTGLKTFDKLQENYDKAQEKSTDLSNDLVHKAVSTGDIKDSADVKAAATAILNSDADPARKEEAREAIQLADNREKFKAQYGAENEATKAQSKSQVSAEAVQKLNPNNLQGPAYFNTLPPALRNTLQAFADGRERMSESALQRSAAGQSLLMYMNAAFPDFDASRADSYFKARQGFTDGKTAITINQGNTSIHHLGNMWDTLDRISKQGDPDSYVGLSGRTSAFLSRNPDGIKLRDAALAVSGELGRLYTGGVVGEGEKKKFEDSLNPYAVGQTVDKLRTAIQEFTTLLGGKLESTQDQWDNAVPSEHIKAPMAIAWPTNIAIYNKIAGVPLNVHATAGRQVTQLQAQFEGTNPQQQAPQGANPAMNPGKAANGTTVYHMTDGSIQDAQGNKYNPSTGQKL